MPSMHLPAMRSEQYTPNQLTGVSKNTFKSAFCMVLICAVCLSLLLAVPASVAAQAQTPAGSENGTETGDGTGTQVSGSSGAGTYPEPDFTARSEADLIRLSNEAPPGSNIFIPPDTTIRSRPGEITFPQDGIMVYSSGGKFGEGGALIRQTAQEDNWMPGVLDFTGQGATVAGIRFVGPYPQGDKGNGEFGPSRPMAVGVSMQGDGGTVYNAEFTGWTHAGIAFEDASNGHVYRSSFHDNYESAIGYGIHMTDSQVLIQYSYFNGNRHGISTNRECQSSYRAEGNIVGGDRPNHAFDVHGEDDSSSKGCGGRRIEIVNNTFLAPSGNSDGSADNPITMRGALGPAEGAFVANNLFIGVDQGEALTQMLESRPPEQIASAANPSQLNNIVWRANAVVADASQAPADVGAPESMPAPSEITRVTFGGSGTGGGGLTPNPIDVQTIITAIGAFAATVGLILVVVIILPIVALLWLLPDG